ncbi:nuclear protein localization, putative [Entamoeba invadens IP1]|uniref:nuclear protein localization, putative n=1 Tax=Entamoeba invadens IP1 TaxID=370355 RepID=UPI0002C3EEDC|nr:nuclear protein localization, putative [Entamoeba invadens IP1]ELP85172.1 nuclear protein localization, putative [Entamoeba invadens IP1]|eukprot:XP_004184518.1 nuclear protein localization, putative [Entamoeba invadens IP1]
MCDIGKCNHGPNQRCLRCMNRDYKKQEEAKQAAKAAQQSGETAPQGRTLKPVVYTLSGKPVEQSQVKPLINEDKVELVNGHQLKEVKGRTIRWLCKHPPGQKCSNCLCPHGGAAEVKRKCNHPPSMRCPNCLPPDPEEQKKKAPPRIYFPSTCPNHGPHGCCTLCLAKMDYEKIRIQKCDATVRVCRVNTQELNRFQKYILERNFYVNRIGILFGEFAKNNNVRVEAIYEPPQVQEDNGDFVFKDQAIIANVDKMMAELGLSKVGVIYSHNGKRKEILTSREAIAAAQRQIDWNPNCLTLVVSPDKNASKVECYQVSEQLVDLVKKALVQPTQADNNSILLKESVYLSQKEIMEVEPVVFVCNVGMQESRRTNSS